jgi:hypothetical protein
LFFWHAGTKRLEYQSTLKLLDNFQYLPGLSEETWDLMVSEVSNTHRALFATLQDSETDPEDSGKYNANVPLRKRRHLNDKTMMASSKRNRGGADFMQHRGPGAPRTKNKASGLPRLSELPGSSDEEDDE